jgi:hypothetical protein
MFIEENREVVEAIEKVAYYLYQEYGQDKVLEFGQFLDLPFHLCIPCEWDSPILDNACLVCGTAKGFLSSGELATFR